MCDNSTTDSSKSDDASFSEKISVVVNLESNNKDQDPKVKIMDTKPSQVNFNELHF